MNFYDVIKPSRHHDSYYHSRITAGYCCAVAEVKLNLIYGNGEQKVLLAIKDALQTKRTLLFWHVLANNYYKDAEEIIVCLPATQFIGEYKNKRSGALLRSYVTNLQQEW